LFKVVKPEGRKRFTDCGVGFEAHIIFGSDYDALIAKIAQKAGMERLLTLNIDHFRKVWQDGENKIIAP